MNIKQIDKTVIEVEKQEIVDGMVLNFLERTKLDNNCIKNVLEEAEFIYRTAKDINEGNYLKIFQDGRALRCFSEEVFERVEMHFFGGGDEEEGEGNVVSFKKASKELLPKELEIVIVDGEEIVGRIPEKYIPY